MASVRVARLLAPAAIAFLLSQGLATANPVTEPVSLSTTHEGEVAVPFIGDPLALPLEVGVSCADPYGGVVNLEVLDAPSWLNRTFEPQDVEVPIDPARCGEDGYYRLPATLHLMGVRRIPVFDPECSPLVAEAPEPIPTPGLEPGQLHVQASRSPEQSPPAYAGGMVRFSRPLAAAASPDLEVTGTPPDGNMTGPTLEGRLFIGNTGDVPLSVCVRVETPPGVSLLGMSTSYSGLMPADAPLAHNVSLIVSGNVTEPVTVRVVVHAVPEIPGAEGFTRAVEWSVVAPPPPVDMMTPEDDVINDTPGLAPLALGGILALAALLRRSRAPGDRRP